MIFKQDMFAGYTR